MKKSIIYLLTAFFVFTLMACPQNSDDSDGCNEVNTVTLSDFNKNSIRVDWSHSCLQCSSWKIGKKRKYLGVWAPFYDYTNVSTSSDFAGHGVVMGNLKKNKDYKFRVKSQGGIACPVRTIGTKSGSTTN